jgi:hypothetical protein
MKNILFSSLLPLIILLFVGIFCGVFWFWEQLLPHKLAVWAELLTFFTPCFLIAYMERKRS